jgi:hypothetical protein
VQSFSLAPAASPPEEFDPVFDPLLQWLETTRLALSIRDTLWLTATLSAVHLVGVTMVGGGALLSGLRLSGAVFQDLDVAEVVRPAVRWILSGMTIAAATGTLLFTPRASAATANTIFQCKMVFLAIGAILQLMVYRQVSTGAGSVRVSGILGSVACFAVIVAGSAYILLE